MPEFYFCHLISPGGDDLLFPKHTHKHSYKLKIHGTVGVHLKHLLPRVDFRVETREKFFSCIIPAASNPQGGEEGGGGSFGGD